MIIYSALFQLSLFAVTSAAPSALGYTHSKRVNGIQWGACDPEFYQVSGEPIQFQINCANLSVPLDYTDSNCSDRINLQLLRVPAFKQPSKGSILLNFGGPGEVGRQGLVSEASELMAIVGYQHDLVIFDPRGTADTLTMSCLNDTERTEFNDKYPLFSNASDTAPGEIWASNGILADICYERKKDIGSFVSTAFVARDLISVVDALGEDGMLRYWGFSYGTTLGATVAAMFPDRMDKVILDGVLNSHEYYHAYELEWISGSDRSFYGFFSGCAATPNNCALARKNATAADLERRFYDFLFDLKYNPLVYGSTVVDYSSVKNVIVGSIYSPSAWPALALSLDGLYKGNATIFLKYSNILLSGILSTATPEADPGIKCSEKDVRTPTLAQMMPAVQAKYNISEILGDVTAPGDMLCAQWKMTAKEIYQGDFHVQTKNPLLFIGNTYDPLTPYVSAKNMSTGFVGSGLIEQVAYGHASIAQPSACTIRAIRSYFLDGTLPAYGMKCETDVPSFSNKTIDDVLKIVDGQ
ncbi:TAP-like protein-domain-containing protein [Xylogone sp. PMI_703]|nr:TAP-like protein-domain-containing protein [Xylogone sp. PMI_703]